MPSHCPIRFLVILAACACIARPALAEGAQTDDTVAEGRHRISGEIGAFSFFGWGSGPAFGLAYAYRTSSAVELGGGLRYELVPARTSTTPSVSRVGSSAPPEYYVFPAKHAWLPFASLRGSLLPGALGRLDLGLTARVAVLVASDASDQPCMEFALAPDFRVWLAHSTALQLAPELALGTTIQDIAPTEDRSSGGRPVILQAAVWLTLVQTF